MKFTEKFDKMLTGLASGFLVPVLIGFIVYLFSPGNPSLSEYYTKLYMANIVTHIVSLCVFTNLALFLLFNRFDMLKASRGVLAMTIVWAILVFGIKFLG
jgi:uncharacterized YccA/Bax inhibitor family protein